MQEQCDAHEEMLNRLTRRLRTLYQCHRTCFQAESEQELLQSICDILVAGGELRLAWIGYCEDDAEKTIRPVAQAGDGLDYLERVKISWGEETEAGQGPFGIAVWTGKACWVDDIRTDPKFSPWREAALAHGYASCVAIPLMAYGKPRGKVDLRGTLNLYSTECNAFDESAVEHYTGLATSLTYAVTALRRRLAEDLTAGVTTLRASDERKRAEEALRERASLLNLTHDTVFVRDMNDIITYWNGGAEELYGWTREEAVGKVSHEIMQTIFPAPLEEINEELLRTGRWEGELIHAKRDGTQVVVASRWALQRDESGNPVAVLETNNDITERKRAEEALRRSEAYLSEAQRLSHTGSCGWNVSSGEIFLSEESFRIGEYDRASKPTLEMVLERVHPEDIILVRETLDRASRDGKGWELEHRLLLPDGSVKYVHVVTQAVRDDKGTLEYVGTVMDITATKRSQQVLEQAFQEIQTLKDQLYNENVALREEIDTAFMFEEIVGASPALQVILARVAKVAPTDSTVLITGETGTGKELIARAIHKHSPRAARAFVSVNCAAIQPSLIASELFGHEKGAFTGALQRRLGRFELADGGTLFLDEIGELPAETQIALLRVLQEREFERVGGTEPIRVDVRVIAATNRDLDAAIAAGTFRSDLFYRLSVFPLEMPPLRARQDDIPLLVEYFIHRYARKAGKKIQGISTKTLELLQAYPWPGNIRELQNVIERSVIVCETETFTVDASWLVGKSRQPQPASLPLTETQVARERALIEAALATCRGRVSGPAGAAAKLGMPRSTLESKIRSLQINKRRFKTA